MSFLLDTNVISESTKPRPDAGVVHWLSAVDEDRTFLSAATLAELRYGVERLSQGARRRRLEDWLTNDLLLRFDGRIISADARIANSWGRIVARRDAIGRRMDPMDAFIAATAIVHELRLVTRNTADFDATAVETINPWSK